MSSVELKEDENEFEADGIATAITKILIDAFKIKESRDPTNEEIAHLIEELTEDRIKELLGESQSCLAEVGNDALSGSEDEFYDDEEDKNNGDSSTSTFNFSYVKPAEDDVVATSALLDDGEENQESVSKKRKAEDVLESTN